MDAGLSAGEHDQQQRHDRGDEQRAAVRCGGGLSGLVAARELRDRGARVAVLEARDRVGGRALSPHSPAGGEGARYDLGASWLWPGQRGLIELIGELGIGLTAQHEAGAALYDQGAGLAPRRFAAPAMGSLRVNGGSQAIAERLAAGLPEATVRLGHRVDDLAVRDDAVHVRGATTDGAFEVVASRAIVALPPRLAVRLGFSPPLPGDVATAMAETPTWMAQTFKVVVGYAEPFWRARGLSGFAVSHVGPLREVHDATVEDAGAGALLGMAMGGADQLRRLAPAERDGAIVAQLVRLFGPPARDVTFVATHDWGRDPATAAGSHDGEGDVAGTYGASALGGLFLDGRVALAATETAAEGAGQLHGAVLAGQRAAQAISGAR